MAGCIKGWFDGAEYRKQAGLCWGASELTNAKIIRGSVSCWPILYFVLDFDQPSTDDANQFTPPLLPLLCLHFGQMSCRRAFKWVCDYVHWKDERTLQIEWKVFQHWGWLRLSSRNHKQVGKMRQANKLLFREIQLRTPQRSPIWKGLSA